MFPGPHTVIAGVPNKSLLLQLYKTKHLFFIKHHTILTVKIFPRFISIISLSLEFPTDFHCGFSLYFSHWSKDLTYSCIKYFYSLMFLLFVNFKTFSNFRWHHLVYILKNPKESTRKLLELINEFNKVAGYKINVQNQLYFYTLAINNQEIKLRK